jgi:hypothetical protein
VASLGKTSSRKFFYGITSYRPWEITRPEVGKPQGLHNDVFEFFECGCITVIMYDDGGILLGWSLFPRDFITIVQSIAGCMLSNNA